MEKPRSIGSTGKQLSANRKSSPLSLASGSQFYDNSGADNEDHQDLYGTSVRSVNSSEVFEGNDAVLKCDFDRHNSLLEVAAWLRDDGKIYLPIEMLVESIKRSLGASGVGGQESFGK